MGRAVSLYGAVLALFCVVLVLLVVPAGAQDDGGIPPGTAANGSNPDNPSGNPDTVTIASEGCRVAEGASVTLQDDENETQAVFTDNKLEIQIIEVDGRVRIKGPNDELLSDHATFPDQGDTSFSTNGNYTVVSSTGITGCRGGNAGDDAGPAQDQYDDSGDDVNNPDDVVPGSTSKQKIPNTGGPPLLILGAALLCAALVVGRNVLRP